MLIKTIYLRSFISLVITFIICIDVIGSTSAKRTPNNQLQQYTGKVDFVCPPYAAIGPCTCGVRENSPSDKEITLNCFQRYLGDARISDILDVFLTSPGLLPFYQIDLQENNLTRVPHQLNLLLKAGGFIKTTNLEYNELTSIEKNSFKYRVSDTSKILLSSNQMTAIAPGAFRGNLLIICLSFNCIITDRMNVNAVVSDGVHKIDAFSRIALEYNNLTRFESTIFQSVLEEMAFLPQTNYRKVEIFRSRRLG